MMKEYIWFIFAVSFIHGTATEPALRFRLTEPGDIALHKDTVRLVKGTDMRVKCETSRSSKQETLLKWIKINDDAFGTQIVSLNLYGLQKQDSGNYSCFNAEYKRRLSLNVLYPPETAEIHSVENSSNTYLRCDADSNPPAKYWWKYSTSAQAKIVKNGSTILLPEVQTNNTWLHCFAQNTMNPTVAPAFKSRVIHTARRVEANEVPAKIVRLPRSYTTYSGFTIDITCDVEGVPPPTVWWTKESDPFIQSGNRLIEEDVQESFAGMYVCNAKNIDKRNATRHATKEIVIKIVAQYQVWTIAVTISGWITTSIVLILALVYICRRRKQREHYRRMVDPPSFRLSEMR